MANVITCAIDVYFGFFRDPTVNETFFTAFLHFLENVAVLGPINYVIYMHWSTLSSEKLAQLKNRKKSVEYVFTQDRSNSVNTGNSIRVGLVKDRHSGDTEDVNAALGQITIIDTQTSEEDI